MIDKKILKMISRNLVVFFDQSIYILVCYTLLLITISSIHVHLFLSHTHSQNMKIDFTEKITEERKNYFVFEKRRINMIKKCL